MKKILVTGGTGFIGSHTVVELMNAGFEPVIIDNLENSSLKVLDGIENITGKKPLFEKIDLRDKAALNSFFNKHTDIVGIIHFAAYKAVGESVEKPLAYYHNNILSLIHLLEEMQHRSIRNFVFSSSCTLYGDADVQPVTEQTPVKKPESPYGNTKRFCEEILEDVVKAQDLKVISLRYFNPIGSHPSAEIGELPIGIPNNLIPYMMQTGIGKRDCLTVYGNDYPTKDGSCVRDYIHVVDLAKAHVIALNRMLNNTSTEKLEVFNLGTGKGVSVLEVIHAFEKVSGVKLNYKIGERRAGDVVQIWADTSFANKVLGWKAETSLEDSVLSAWNWEKKLAS